MKPRKKISPQAILALKEALPLIYWKKDQLQEYLKLALNNNAILSTLNWSGTKREAVKELIERMTNRPDLFQDDLLSLLIHVAEFSDFDNLKYWDDDGTKVSKARSAVKKVKNLVTGHVKLSNDDEEARKRKLAAEQMIQTNKSLASELGNLRVAFNELTISKNHQRRGYDFEKFLYNLFLLYELEPKGSFKNYGEQIDGAFTFQGADYLLEAKWARQVEQGDIANFCFKVESKFKTSIGLLVTIEGVSPQAISPHFKSIIVMDGFDLIAILDGRISLPDLLFKKRRRATETGKIYVNFSELENS